MRYYVSPNERWPSVLLHVASLTSSRGPHICPGTWLGDSPTLFVEGTNILVLVATLVRSNQLHITPTVIFSWNPYWRSWDTRRDSVEFPGIKILDSRKKFLENLHPNYRLTLSLWRDPDNVPHCRILSPDKTEWRLISATLCGWRRCIVADQLW